MAPETRDLPEDTPRMSAVTDDSIPWLLVPLDDFQPVERDVADSHSLEGVLGKLSLNKSNCPRYLPWISSQQETFYSGLGDGNRVAYRASRVMVSTEGATTFSPM